MNDTKATAPSVTPADIEANIAIEWYIHPGEKPICDQPIPAQHPLRMLTICVLVTKNGHTVTGESHCQDPAKFDPEIGRAEARKDAIRKLWPMVVYEQRSRLANQ